MNGKLNIFWLVVALILLVVTPVMAMGRSTTANACRTFYLHAHQTVQNNGIDGMFCGENDNEPTRKVQHSNSSKATPQHGEQPTEEVVATSTPVPTQESTPVPTQITEEPQPTACVDDEDDDQGGNDDIDGEDDENDECDD